MKLQNAPYGGYIRTKREDMDRVKKWDSRASIYRAVKLVLQPVIFIAAIKGVAEAQVYEWTDPRGVRHFSSEKQGDNFKKADLPPLLREKTYKKSTKSTASGVKPLHGCAEHGGIDCQAGADSDGSVVCTDGFRDAVARYRFSCSMPKLTVSEVVPGNELGSFTVIVRNESGVAATKPSITLSDSLGKPTITGPDSVAPHEIGEFKVVGASAIGKSEDVVIKCENCG
jgi:hypothetical protein